MKLYGDTLSPFVRATLVVAHETGLAGKLEQIKEAVIPTQENSRLAALSPAQAKAAFRQYVERYRACRKNAAPDSPRSKCASCLARTE